MNGILRVNKNKCKEQKHGQLFNENIRQRRNKNIIKKEKNNTYKEEKERNEENISIERIEREYEKYESRENRRRQQEYNLYKGDGTIQYFKLFYGRVENRVYIIFKLIIFISLLIIIYLITLIMLNFKELFLVK